ncbi:sigma 54-interacting transcriptional regulator [candidate division KSB1 bacterium]
MKIITTEKLHSLISNPAVENLLKSTLKTITELTNAEDGLLYLYDDANNKFILHYSFNKNGTYSHYSSKFDDILLENIIHSKESNNILSITANKDHFTNISSILNKSYSHSIASKLNCDNYTFGIIETVRKDDDNPFSEADLQTLKKIISLAESTLKESKVTGIPSSNKARKLGINISGMDVVTGKSPAMLEILNNIANISKTNATVLLMGESGTGKEVLAKVIHHNSDRFNEPFVRINCAAIPETLLESELFGHEKGAFTGAIAKKFGRFELSDKGTAFLDEIAEMPLKLQAKMLNFLQEKEFERIGGTNTIKIDVRIIAATNKNLEKAIEENQFREDLYYRLNVFPIYLPPLRDRIEDVPVFVDYFLKKYREEMAKNVDGISDEAMFLLKKYSWPGNIRELGNIIERAIVITSNSIITPHDLPQEIFGLVGKVREQSREFKFREGTSTLWELEKGIIERALRETNYNQSLAAKKLGITRNHLRYRIKKWKISVKPTGEFRFREGTSSLWELEKDIIERVLRETNYNQSLAAKKLGITGDDLQDAIKKWNISINANLNY